MDLILVITEVVTLQHRGVVDDIEELDLAVPFIVDIFVTVAMDKIEAI